MVIFKYIEDVKYYLENKREEGFSIAFIPTMGALHYGHISLINEAKQANVTHHNSAASLPAKKLTVASIFVNPTQFNDKEDFEKYPVSGENDIQMLAEAGCDVLFMPQVAEMYPGGPEKMPSFDFGYLETILEGAQRPGHFKGVGQVVARLLDIIQPNELYLGQKDYQQCMVLKDLIRQLGKENTLSLHISPTQREPDGLAMSSRNRRLTEPQRAIAALIYQCLVSIQAKQATDPFALVQKECEDLLKEKGFSPEYISLADANNLELLTDFDSNRKMIALIAAKLGNVRLIDNMVLN